MHMSDALITPVVGGVMLISSIGVGKYSLDKMKEDITSKIPLMAIMGAFIFAFQMINFTIPGTGSSGHIGGGLLLSIVLGPYAAFLTLAIVLLIQALFFGDGGLIAYGCTLFNLGFFTCFVAYPFIFRLLTKFDRDNKKIKRVILGSIVASIIGLQLGSFGVVLQTTLSGRTDLPFIEFLSLMQGIHILIGLVEGVITGVIVKYLVINNNSVIYELPKKSRNTRRVFIMFAISTVVIAGFISIFASSHPDGLEWAIEKIVGEKEIPFLNEKVSRLSDKQGELALFPDYGFKKSSSDIGTSVSGLTGSLIVFTSVFLMGLLYRKRKLRNE
ncbi:cobalamin biosynthesis protein CbiM [Thiospirochaeta perfilievii]|uniref:Cobalamin biosynthesis protein CbiM n=1 Tax=Thiospirochaeta perfilievii TaxID=252967 RepID=A0A5C1Q665_9SPIO|nr:energy-coupling factor ABC transporter permease [Thiospirochaeta perfilievii]QEN03465.1 cobalamin biosynthesis protein CbiM [Thiospirochaeta perfilievii]